MNTLPHHPIMVAEILHTLQVQTRADATYIDGTLGAGGHTHAILETHPECRVLALDLDPDALVLAHARLTPYQNRVHLIQASYLEMAYLATEMLGASQVDGILLDLGVSSMQLDQAQRGFSFRFDGALDMRFDPASSDPTAADLINTLSAEELADIFYRYGEERHSRRIARAIVQSRPFHTTTQLADRIAALHLSHEKIHPATRVFQALRIAVNHELEAVESVLPIAVNCLKPGGRLAIITFHSLEDRLVKQFFKQESTNCLCPPRQPICTCHHRASLALITHKPITAGEAEVSTNPRARSAKLRVAERL